MCHPEDSRNPLLRGAQKRWATFKLGLGEFVLALMVGVLAAFLRVRGTPPRVPLVVNAEDLDRGTVFVTEAFRFSLRLKNVSHRDVEIAEIRSSCRCTSFEPIPVTIPSGHSARINAIVDLSPGSSEEASFPSRPFSVRLVAIISGEASYAYPRWEVRGIVRAPLVFSPWEPSFGEGDLTRGSQFRPLDVAVLSHSALQELSATCDDGLATVRVVPKAGKDGSYQLTVAPRAGLNLGEYVFQIRFRGVTADGERFDGVPLQVRGTVVDDVEIVPPMIAAGAVAVGQTVVDTLLLRSRSRKPFAVTELHCASDAVGCEPIANDDEPDQHRFRVTLCASKAGSQQADVVFTVRGTGESDAREVPLHLVYFRKQAGSFSGLEADQ